MTLAEAYQYEPSSILYGIWERALTDVPRGTLQTAFEQLVKTWKPEFGRKFPAPADLRAIIDKARETGIQELVERLWHSCLNVIRDQNPDLGWREQFPQLTTNEHRCIKAAGGWVAIWNMNADELVWAKKRFIEAFVRGDEFEKVQALLPGDLRAELEGVAAKKALTHAPAPVRPPESVPTPPLERPPAPIAHHVVEFTEEDLARRKQKEHEKVADWVKAHPEVKL